MSCHYPLTCWRSNDLSQVGSKGTLPLVFREDQGLKNTKMEIACGRCAGCRLDKARDWAIRCVHEASLHKESCFLTLTYNPESLPPGGSLVKEDMQKFLKRLRRRHEYFINEHGKKEKRTIRFFQAGEYGECCKNCGLSRPRCRCGAWTPGLGRPHHHCLLFGYSFPDREVLRMGKYPLFFSPELTLGKNPLWPHGFASIGELNFDTACYTARYILKKITGDPAEDHYQGKKPEFITMSRRPGIGKEWYDRFSSDLYNHDTAVVRDGFLAKPPKYYDSLFELDNPSRLALLKNRRKEYAKNNPENTEERRAVKAELAAIKLNQTSRTYETGEFKR